MNLLLLIICIVMPSDTVYLSQKEAIEIGLENSPLLLASQAQVQSAEAKKYSARSVFFPQVKLDANYRRVSLVQEMKSFQIDSLVMTGSGAFIPVGHTITIPFGQNDNYSLNLGVSQAIFSWGSLLRSYQMALINLQDNILTDSLNRESFVVQVKQLYTYALILREFVDLSLKVDEELKEHYETTKRKYDLGAATEIELLQAESKYKNNRIQVLEAERSYRETIDMLKLILNMKENTEVVLTDSLFLDSAYVSGLMESMLDVENRYDIKSLKNKQKLLDLNMKIYSASNLPSLFYSFNYMMQKPFGFENIWKDYWALTIGVSFPIFDGLKSNYQVRDVQYQKKALEYTLAFQQSSSYVEHKKALRNLEDAMMKYETQRDNLRVAEALFNTVKKQYEMGLATQLDYIDAETNYFAQRAYLLQALGDCVLKSVELEKVFKGIK
ncbi:MAG TPA: TolC family protein [Candidatus Hydrothermia bacterium]|mgnify:CR=1 FL=1|nr:TolC family protein [Candidatus Hydrothermae bacterium]MDD3648511.1 TolC family protein [Candidatus Hydrothermia bacterium]MDD5572489.1 TolC family protein [Candidatus Hydrothermia bacterium]HOK23719.1 TolC family protein [Candidatus Hydrothermia bacterium]HOL24428.1 TolC family protein [Candidatus Hydrothermia bacterium]